MLVKLGDIAEVLISNVDKKSKPNEKEIKLCNFVDVYKNYAITDRMTSSFMVATASNQSIEKFTIKKGYLAITKDSETRDDIGVGTYFADDFDNLLLGYHCALIKPNNKLVYSKYLNAFIQSNFVRKYYELNASGSGQRYTLTLESILSTPILLPDYDKQVLIGDMLSNTDHQIERNNLMVKKLQVLSQGIFNKFFSNETNHISLLDFPYIQIIKPGIDRFEGSKHYIATAEVDKDKVNYNAPLIEYETRENRANMQPVKNSVWFAKLKNSIKHIYVSNVDSMLCSNYIFSTGFAGIKCEDIVYEYLIDFINTSYFEMKKDILSHGATMEGVNNDDLKSIQIPLPSKDRLVDFHNKVKKIHYQITMLNEQTFKLNNLKEKILPLLINQQLS